MICPHEWMQFTSCFSFSSVPSSMIKILMGQCAGAAWGDAHGAPQGVARPNSKH